MSETYQTFPERGTPVNCPTCNAPFTSKYRMEKHRRELHPETIAPRNATQKKKPIEVVSAYDVVLKAEKALGDAIRDLDAERTLYVNKVKDIDTKLAKYRVAGISVYKPLPGE